MKDPGASKELRERFEREKRLAALLADDPDVGKLVPEPRDESIVYPYTSRAKKVLRQTGPKHAPTTQHVVINPDGFEASVRAPADVDRFDLELHRKAAELRQSKRASKADPVNAEILRTIALLESHMRTAGIRPKTLAAVAFRLGSLVRLADVNELIGKSHGASKGKRRGVRTSIKALALALMKPYKLDGVQVKRFRKLAEEGFVPGLRIVTGKTAETFYIEIDGRRTDEMGSEALRKWYRESADIGTQTP